MVFLTRISVRGFKSFAQRVAFDFGPGLTGVVGPNGCGKSNLVDAIRWAMGEQRSSQLRGTRMDQVIFNGSRDTAPAGAAEVTIAFNNRARILPVDQDEVKVARRLLRTGESEYEISDSACRLSDVLNLFFDTGLGSHSYSILTREMIDAIVSDRAEDRRFLFEEAAGISRYKHRKRAAVRKLEGVEGDIVRLGDILREVERQVRSLSNQAARARRFRRYADELQSLEVSFAAREHAELVARSESAKREMDAAADGIAAAAAEVASSEAAAERLRSQAVDMERSVGSAAAEAFEVERKCRSAESETAVDRERLQSLKTQLSRDADEMSALGARRATVVERIRELTAERERVASSLSLAEAAWADAQASLGALDGRRDALRTAADGAVDELSEAERRIAAIDGETAALDAERGSLVERKAERDDELARLADERGRREAERSAALARVADAERRLSDLRARQESLVAAKDSDARALESLRDGEVKLSASLEASKARLLAVRAIVERHEGFGGGVRAVLESASVSGVYGAVGEVLRVRPDHQLAVEAALGDSASFIVAEDRGAARDAIKFLREGKRGRATFIALSEVRGRGRPALPDGALCWLDECVSTDARFAALAEFLLGSVAVARSAEDCERVLAAGVPCATLDGELFRPDGAFSGGVRSEGEIALVGRDLEIDRVVDEVARLEAELGQVRDAITAARQRIADHELSLAAVATDVSAESDVRASAERTLAQIDFEEGNATERSDHARRVSDELSSRIAALDERATRIAEAREQCESALAEAGRSAKSSRDDLERFESERAGVAARFSEVQIETVSLRAKREGIDAEERRSAELLAEVEEGVEERNRRCAEAERQIAELSARLDSASGVLRGLFAELDERRGEVKRREEALSVFREKIAAVERELSSLRSRRSERERALHELELGAVEARTRIASLSERVYREYEVDVAGREPEALTDEQWGARGARLEFLRKARERIGAVNLLAEQEHDEQSKRAEFLRAQIADLHAARADLHEVISELNGIARERFGDVFEKVRENFRTIFVRLFEGGAADLTLEEGVDVLDADIQIVARPKGKRLQSIAQLSSGERALTAIALLFAMYLVRPSPFAVLDEVDAPLDDANVERFLGIVREFSKDSQFLVITHNRRTMAACDVLFGITMEEPGSSKVVEVRFEDLPAEPPAVAASAGG